MIIANPIYDAAFKRLMENRRIACFFVQTLIDETVEDIAMMPQEYTYHSISKRKAEKDEKHRDTTRQLTNELSPDEWDVLSLIRYDFVATVRTAGGETKKILIEIQKSNNSVDLARFRTYLGEQYRKTDVVEVKSGKVEKSLPIVCIYLLGFKLQIKSPAIKVDRKYHDMIKKSEIAEKDEWIEALTHDGYFVQIPRVEGKPASLLEKLLSVFEQQYFIDDMKTRKEYEYPLEAGDDNLKGMLDVLRHAAADAQTRRDMEEEWWVEKRMEETEKTARENLKLLETIEESQKSLAEAKKSLAEKDRSLAEKDKEIEELKKLLRK
jgi:hypothetical protein